MTSAEVLEIDRQNILKMAEGAGRNSARLGTPRHLNAYPNTGLHDEQREAWFRGYDAEKAELPEPVRARAEEVGAA